ncbi:MAG: SdpI family protein [Oscillospiraceae bacterium]
MGFWVFMLIVDMIVPLTMMGFGRYFSKSAPKEINSLFGYRTARSMKNKDTWTFAHNYCGRLWFISGIVLFPVSVIPLLCVTGREINTVSAVGLTVCIVQVIAMTASIIPVEKALKRTFDENGNRRS